MKKQMLTILSMLLLLGLTAAANAQLLPPSNLTASAGDGYVHLEWDEPGEEPDLVLLRQHSNNHVDGYYQQFNIGYGVVFDLADYPGATLEIVDFRHASWGVMGTWEYKIHVVDWTTFQSVEVFGPYDTTGNDVWEMDISLDGLAGNDGLMGVLIEPMGNTAADAYPCISADGTLDGFSVIAPLTDFSDYSMSTDGGDFLIDLWIQPADGSSLVKSERVIPVNETVNQYQTRSGSSFTISGNHEMTQTAYQRELLGYNIYRDTAMINVDPILLTEYTDEDVENDITYSYYVTAVYTEGESEPSNTVEATPQGGGGVFPPPFNLTASLVGEDSVLLNWEEPEFGDWFHWDDGENYNNIGLTAPGTFKVAARFSPDHLADFGVVGQYLTEVRFFLYQGESGINVNVWTGGTPTNPGTLVVDQNVPNPQFESWNTVELDDPVYISGTEELWIGYHLDFVSGHPAGGDIGPALDGIGNMVWLNNTWDTMLSLLPTFNSNWNIQGFASFAAGRELTPIGQAKRSDHVAQAVQLDQAEYTTEISDLSMIQSTRKVAAPPTIERRQINYRVYRNDVNIAEVDETTYLDSGLEPGVYQYYVTALYDEGESNPSNVVTINTEITSVLFDDFESYQDFALLFPPWTLIDLDQSPTYGIQDVEFPNAGEAMAFMIFNPSETTPPLDEEAYSGNKMAASFAAQNAVNNDWMITPQLGLGDNSTLSFWAKSYTDAYGLERMRVGVSATSMNPTTFNILTEEPYVQVPTTWTQYTFDLSEWDNHNIWIGINCVSDDAFILFIDDFHVQSVLEVDVDDYLDTPSATRLMGNYPNPFNPETTINFALEQAGMVSLEVFNVKGQKVATVVDGFMEAGSHSIVWNGKTDQNRDAGSGVFFYRMKSGDYSSTKKMILMK